MSDLPDDAELRTIEFQPRWYLNGFPKAGLHLAVQMIEPISDPMPEGQFRGKPWAGGFAGHSWTAQMADVRQTMYWLGEIRRGNYYKGHCGWLHDLEAFMWCLGLAHVFIYRDLRDVAVSQTYHILSDKGYLLHPGRDRYRALGGKDEVLKAVIVGLDEFPGIMERWEFFAPWVDVDWVYKFKFEDAVANPFKIARELVLYGLNRLAEIFGIKFLQPQIDDVAEAMATSARQKESSPTFRAGRVGDWRAEFNEEHKQLFKQTDQNNWLVKLGYETSRDW